MGVNLKKYCRVKGAIAHRGRSLASTIALLLTAKGCQRKAAFVFLFTINFLGITVTNIIAYNVGDCRRLYAATKEAEVGCALDDTVR